MEAVAGARAAVICGRGAGARAETEASAGQQHAGRDDGSDSDDGERRTRGAGSVGTGRKRGAPARVGAGERRARTERGEGGAAPEVETAARREAEAAVEEDADAALAAAAATTPQRPKRKEGPTAPTYVHTRQYRKRQKSEGYMLRNGHSAVLSKRAVEIGPATVERTTGGQYDWQDGGLRKRKQESTAGGDGERRLRPRDPGKGDEPPPT